MTDFLSLWSRPYDSPQLTIPQSSPLRCASLQCLDIILQQSFHAPPTKFCLLYRSYAVELFYPAFYRTFLIWTVFTYGHLLLRSCFDFKTYCHQDQPAYLKLSLCVYQPEPTSIFSWACQISLPTYKTLRIHLVKSSISPTLAKSHTLWVSYKGHHWQCNALL